MRRQVRTLRQFSLLLVVLIHLDICSKGRFAVARMHQPWLEAARAKKNTVSLPGRARCFCLSVLPRSSSEQAHFSRSCWSSQIGVSLVSAGTHRTPLDPNPNPKSLIPSNLQTRLALLAVPAIASIARLLVAAVS